MVWRGCCGLSGAVARGRDHPRPLLIVAGLMVKSVVQLRNLQMPFAIANVLTARVDLPPSA